MASRAAHGRARDLGAVVVYETKPTDEQGRPTLAVGADPLSAGRDPRTKRVTTREAAAALARLPRRSRMVPAKVASCPEFKRYDEDRQRWLAGRTAEIQQAHGGVSRGVGARLNAAAWAYAAGQFANEKGAQTGDAKWFALGATQAAHAKTLDDAAWELARLEASAKPRTDDAAFWAGLASAKTEES